jgi:hypothetical protein
MHNMCDWLMASATLHGCIQKPKREWLIASRCVELTREDLQQYFHLPLAEACEKLGFDKTAFKSQCRKLGVAAWPRRRLMSIIKMQKELEQIDKDERRIQELRRLCEQIIKNPSLSLDEDTIRLRQALFKRRFMQARASVEAEEDLEKLKASPPPFT